MPMTTGRLVAFLCAFMSAPAAARVSAQAPAPYRSETAAYVNEQDGTELSGMLALPSGPGPHPGVVVLTVAGTGPLVDRLVGQGYAVLTPTLRGFAAVEPLLRAGYADLAADLRAALDHLGTRPEVDGAALGLIAQADNAPPAMLAAVGAAVPLILLAPPGFEGTEVFRLEQRWLAERAGARPTELAELERYVAEIAEIAMSERPPYEREYLLQALRARSGTDLPPNAAFPSDERQAHFFASPLWHDRLAFHPERVLADVGAPVLVLIGTEDPNLPFDDYATAIRRGLTAARTPDATFCRVPGRTRHTFTDAATTAMLTWLVGRVGAPDPSGAAGVGPPVGCLPDDPDG